MRARVGACGVIGLVLVFFLLDRFTKYAAVHLLPPTAGDFFYRAPLTNQAGPFSLPAPATLLIALAVVALLWLVHLGLRAVQQHKWWRVAGVAFMLVGGFSNLWDRLVWGGVVDVWYLALGGGLSFNLADVYLLWGVMLVAWSYRGGVR
ncbi:MAG: signal peptidase II [Candidatus Veblenbacteria bacterium]|nr:signal peptidase II [Candidatus Veblenbacteria bacterium]